MGSASNSHFDLLQKMSAPLVELNIPLDKGKELTYLIPVSVQFPHTHTYTELGENNKLSFRVPVIVKLPNSYTELVEKNLLLQGELRKSQKHVGYLYRLLRRGRK
jgi:hypothetical protein